MSRRTTARRLAAFAALAAMSFGGLNAAGASARGPAAPATPSNPVTKSVSELYTGVAPCRLVDTRIAGGPLVSVRHFDASGNLSAQGGSSTCGIPTRATSIAINVTAITAGPGRGYLRGWPFMGGPVNATLLNYSDAINMSNLVNLPLCDSGSCIDAFDLRNYGSSVDVVVDVLGYYQRPLFANIGVLGARGDTSGVVAAARPSIGLYTINFDRDVDSCTATVTDTDPGSAHTFNVTPNPGQPWSLQIHVKDMNGALANAPFAIHVTC